MKTTIEQLKESGTWIRVGNDKKKGYKLLKAMGCNSFDSGGNTLTFDYYCYRENNFNKYIGVEKAPNKFIELDEIDF